MESKTVTKIIQSNTLTLKKIFDKLNYKYALINNFYKLNTANCKLQTEHYPLLPPSYQICKQPISPWHSRRQFSKEN